MKKNILKKCKICGNNIKIVDKIKFKHLVGLEEEYIEYVGYCNKCGFIFNATPFTDEQLSNRYKENSKYELGNGKAKSVVENNLSYISRCQYQKDFIDRNSEKYKSVLEIGAASGYAIT